MLKYVLRLSKSEQLLSDLMSLKIKKDTDLKTNFQYSLSEVVNGFQKVSDLYDILDEVNI